MFGATWGFRKKNTKCCTSESTDEMDTNNNYFYDDVNSTSNNNLSTSDAILNVSLSSFASTKSMMSMQSQLGRGNGGGGGGEGTLRSMATASLANKNNAKKNSLHKSSDEDDSGSDDESSPVYLTMEETLNLGVLDHINRQIAILDPADTEHSAELDSFLLLEDAMALDEGNASVVQVEMKSPISRKRRMRLEKESQECYDEYESKDKKTTSGQPIQQLPINSGDNRKMYPDGSPKTQQEHRRIVRTCSEDEGSETSHRSFFSEEYSLNAANQRDEMDAVLDDVLADDALVYTPPRMNPSTTKGNASPAKDTIADRQPALSESHHAWLNCLEENGVDLNASPLVQKSTADDGEPPVSVSNNNSAPAVSELFPPQSVQEYSTADSFDPITSAPEEAGERATSGESSRTRDVLKTITWEEDVDNNRNNQVEHELCVQNTSTGILESASSFIIGQLDSSHSFATCVLSASRVSEGSSYVGQRKEGEDAFVVQPQDRQEARIAGNQAGNNDEVVSNPDIHQQVVMDNASSSKGDSTAPSRNSHRPEQRREEEAERHEEEKNNRGEERSSDEEKTVEKKDDQRDAVLESLESQTQRDDDDDDCSPKDAKEREEEDEECNSDCCSMVPVVNVSPSKGKQNLAVCAIETYKEYAVGGESRPPLEVKCRKDTEANTKSVRCARNVEQDGNCTAHALPNPNLVSALLPEDDRKHASVSRPSNVLCVGVHDSIDSKSPRLAQSIIMKAKESLTTIRSFDAAAFIPPNSPTTTISSSMSDPQGGTRSVHSSRFKKSSEGLNKGNQSQLGWGSSASISEAAQSKPTLVSAGIAGLPATVNESENASRKGATSPMLDTHDKRTTRYSPKGQTRFFFEKPVSPRSKTVKSILETRSKEDVRICDVNDDLNEVVTSSSRDNCGGPSNSLSVPAQPINPSVPDIRRIDSANDLNDGKRINPWTGVDSPRESVSRSPRRPYPGSLRLGSPSCVTIQVQPDDTTKTLPHTQISFLPHDSSGEEKKESDLESLFEPLVAPSSPGRSLSRSPRRPYPGSPCLRYPACDDTTKTRPHAPSESSPQHSSGEEKKESEREFLFEPSVAPSRINTLPFNHQLAPLDRDLLDVLKSANSTEDQTQDSFAIDSPQRIAETISEAKVDVRFCVVKSFDELDDSYNARENRSPAGSFSCHSKALSMNVDSAQHDIHQIDSANDHNEGERRPVIDSTSVSKTKSPQEICPSVAPGTPLCVTMQVPPHAATAAVEHTQIAFVRHDSSGDDMKENERENLVAMKPSVEEFQTTTFEKGVGLGRIASKSNDKGVLSLRDEKQAAENAFGTTASDPYIWAYVVWSRNGLLDRTKWEPILPVDESAELDKATNDEVEENGDLNESFSFSPLIHKRNSIGAYDFSDVKESKAKLLSTTRKSNDRQSFPLAPSTVSEGAGAMRRRNSFANVMKMWRDKSEDRALPQFLSPETTTRSLSNTRSRFRSNWSPTKEAVPVPTTTKRSGFAFERMDRAGEPVSKDWRQTYQNDKHVASRMNAYKRDSGEMNFGARRKIASPLKLIQDYPPGKLSMPLSPSLSRKSTADSQSEASNFDTSLRSIFRQIRLSRDEKHPTEGKNWKESDAYYDSNQIPSPVSSVVGSHLSRVEAAAPSRTKSQSVGLSHDRPETDEEKSPSFSVDLMCQHSSQIDDNQSGARDAGFLVRPKPSFTQASTLHVRKKSSAFAFGHNNHPTQRLPMSKGRTFDEQLQRPSPRQSLDEPRLKGLNRDRRVTDSQQLARSNADYKTMVQSFFGEADVKPAMGRRINQDGTIVKSNDTKLPSPSFFRSPPGQEKKLADTEIRSAVALLTYRQDVTNEIDVNSTNSPRRSIKRVSSYEKKPHPTEVPSAVALLTCRQEVARDIDVNSSNSPRRHSQHALAYEKRPCPTEFPSTHLSCRQNIPSEIAVQEEMPRNAISALEYLKAYQQADTDSKGTTAVTSPRTGDSLQCRPLHLVDACSFDGADSVFSEDDEQPCDCVESILTGKVELSNFFLPKMGMACICGKRGGLGLAHPDEPTSLKNILRPWQVRFLAGFGISRGDQLVKANHRSAQAMASALRQYRRKHKMTPFRTKSCGMAIQIWARTAKTYVRSIRKQLVDGTHKLEPPNMMEILSSFLDKMQEMNHPRLMPTSESTMEKLSPPQERQHEEI